MRKAAFLSDLTENEAINFRRVQVVTQYNTAYAPSIREKKEMTFPGRRDVFIPLRLSSVAGPQSGALTTFLV
jgi:hypothetical protein